MTAFAVVAFLQCIAMPLWADSTIELAGVAVTPHVIAPQMRYRRDPDPELGARVQLFVHNRGRDKLKFTPESVIRLRDTSPDDLVARDDWTWHDFPGAWPNVSLELPPDCLTVWSFNGKRAAWGVGTKAKLEIDSASDQVATECTVQIAAPSTWISAVTFLGDAAETHPDKMVVHVANERDVPLRILSCRLWFPENNQTYRTLHRGAEYRQFESWPTDGVLPPKDRGVICVRTGPLPLTYTAIQVQLEDGDGVVSTLWAHLRVKRETFDISGGWVQGGSHGPQAMTFEPWLKTLRRMHVNTAHLADQFPGYTDQTEPGGLYARYPLKFFNRLSPPEKYESAEMLPRIHAVEFLGEPQYGGGRPVPPMEVWRKLAPYQASKLPTSVTHSEERIWRYYSGLSDFPHYDAYRVCAPSADAWFKYDRWADAKIGWGAPLETIGDMCRSLRELNRPMPTAYWSQGPHSGWGPSRGRLRASPTPDELRLQAYHALSSRITSLYWFNLSMDSVVKYRDTIEELTRVGREIRMLSEFYLSGDAYRHTRVDRDGRPDWDLASIASPSATLLFALDLDYKPDRAEKVFRFGPPREVRLTFSLPPWNHTPVDVFRADADGTHNVEYVVEEGEITISDTLSKVGIYVAAASADIREKLETRRQALFEYEAAFEFDPAGNDQDFAVLKGFVDSSR